MLKSNLHSPSKVRLRKLKSHKIFLFFCTLLLDITRLIIFISICYNKIFILDLLNTIHSMSELPLMSLMILANWNRKTWRKPLKNLYKPQKDSVIWQHWMMSSTLENFQVIINDVCFLFQDCCCFRYYKMVLFRVYSKHRFQCFGIYTFWKLN